MSKLGTEWIRCESWGHVLYFFHIARKMNNVCFCLHDQVIHDINAIDCCSSKSAIWADINIRLILNITAQSVISTDTDIRLTVNITARCKNNTNFSIYFSENWINGSFKSRAHSEFWKRCSIKLCSATQLKIEIWVAIVPFFIFLGLYTGAWHLNLNLRLPLYI